MNNVGKVVEEMEEENWLEEVEVEENDEKDDLVERE